MRQFKTIEQLDTAILYTLEFVPQVWAVRASATVVSVVWVASGATACADHSALERWRLVGVVTLCGRMNTASLVIGPGPGSGDARRAGDRRRLLPAGLSAWLCRGAGGSARHRTRSSSQGRKLQ